MLNSKRYRRTSDLFRSRFLAAGEDAALIRDARRLREYLAGQAILASLQVGFLVALGLFSRTVWNLFARHGEALNPWFLRVSLFGILVCFLLVGRRLLARIGEIRAVRADLAEADRRLRGLREELQRSVDDHRAGGTVAPREPGPPSTTGEDHP